MKKILFLFSIVLLSSCACMIGQVPPQTIYVGDNCQALLPDYTLIVTTSDNCGTVVLSQVPAANTILNVDNPIVNVIVTGTDRFGNKSSIVINVSLIDTVPPVLSWPAGQIAMTESKVMYLYNNWVEALKVYGIAQWMADLTWMDGNQFADTTVYNNMRYFQHTISITDAELAQYVSLLKNK